MKVRVARWGNSLGVRLPKAVVDAMAVTAGTDLDLLVENGEARLRYPSKTSTQMLKELVDKIDPNNLPAMIEWGVDVGSEIIDDDYSRGLIVEGPDGAPVEVNAAKARAGKSNARSRRR